MKSSENASGRTLTEVEARNPYTATIALAEKASKLAKFIRGSRERTAERRSRRDA